MNRALKIITSLLMVVSLAFVVPVNNTYAAEKTADFDIDPQLWKCIVETNMFNYDDNDDGVVTKEEFGSAYGIMLDCEGYNIQDWSALQYGTEWQMVALRNCAGGDFSSLADLEQLREVSLNLVSGANAVIGLEKSNSLTELTISTDTEVDLSQFKGYPKLSILSISANKFTNYESLADIAKLRNLSLSGDSIENIEGIPELPNVYTLSLGFSALDNTKMTEIAKKFPNVNDVAISGSAITNLDWLLEFNKLYLEHIKVSNNQISDVSIIVDILEAENSRLNLVRVSGNPLSEESRIKLVKSAIQCGDTINGVVGRKVKLYDSNHPIIDIVDYNDFEIESADNNIAEVKDNYLEIKNIGSTKLKFKYEDIEFEYTVVVPEISKVLTVEHETTVETFDMETGKLTISGTGMVREDLSESSLNVYRFKFPWEGSEVKSLVIEEGIESIHPSSFEEYYTNLESVILPSSMKWIYERAFYGCTSLREISISEPCTLGDSAFEGCTALSNISLPEGSVDIGKDCFKDTAAWNDESNFKDNVFYIGNIAVAYKPTNYDLNNEIVLREDTDTVAIALLKDSKVRAVTFPDGLETISSEVCNGCKYLVGAFIPDSVTKIKEDAFLKCQFLTIYCNEGSYAQQYAIENDIPYDTVNKDLSNAISVEEINAIYRDMNKTPEPTPTIEPSDNPIPSLAGDVNLDEQVNAEDALLVLKHAAKIEILSDGIVAQADLNKDNAVDAADALEVLKIAAKITE